MSTLPRTFLLEVGVRAGRLFASNSRGSRGSVEGLGAAVIWSGAIALLPGGASAQVAGATAFVDVAVIPMDRERVLTHRTVLVQGDRIVALGPVGNVAIPPRTTRIDGRGKFLLPGLADMHAHTPTIHAPRNPSDYLGSILPAARRQLFLYVANGVTTIRVMRGRPEALVLRAQAAKGAILSPRLYVAADPIITRSEFVSIDMGTASATVLDSVKQYIAAVKSAGYDFLKIYGEHGVLLDTIAAAARRVGLPIAGHPPDDIDDDGSIMDAIRAGLISVEHLLHLGLGGSYDEAKIRANGLKLKRAGIWVCPTLIHITGLDDPSLYTDSRYFRDPVPATHARPDPAIYTQKPEVRAIKLLNDLGVNLLLGTDAGGSGSTSMRGFSVHRELAALVAAGLSPYEALVTGTRNPAVYFGTLDSMGTIAVGKRADLALLTGNPMEDIHYTAQPAGVMLAGRWFTRAELDQILLLLEGTIDRV